MLLITTHYGMQLFSHFEYIYNQRMGVYNLNFYNNSQKILSLEFEEKIPLINALESLYYTIANAAPGPLLIDYNKVLRAASEKEYLGYETNP